MDLFISDLHLDPSRPETSQLFFDFIDGPARSAATLYILGDLFEYWAGDDDLGAPLNAQVGAAIGALSARGIPVLFLGGNRDFLIGRGFCAATGTALLPDIGVRSVAGTPTLLLHGDTLCTDDFEYQHFRANVRDPTFIASFLKRPLQERKTHIEGLRRASEESKSGKSAAIMDANEDAVRIAFRAANVSRMIHGHTHRLATHRYDIDGRACERWVLGDWGATGNFLECRPEGWRFHSWDGKQATTIKS